MTKMRKTRRNNKKSTRIVRRVYAPIHHVLQTTKKVLNAGINAIDKAGNAVASGANGAIHGVVGKKNRKQRKTHRNRK
jgi:hypothetical protein